MTCNSFLYSNVKEPNYLSKEINSGGEGTRTLDPRLARAVLSQLSYSPKIWGPEYSQDLVGLGGLEPPTSRLSGVRSNQLSYRPLLPPPRVSA